MTNTQAKFAPLSVTNKISLRIFDTLLLGRPIEQALAKIVLGTATKNHGLVVWTNCQCFGIFFPYGTFQWIDRSVTYYVNKTIASFRG